MGCDAQPVVVDNLNLTRLSLVYAIEEDRVQLSAVDSEGTSLKLWLTARLVNLLVPQLVRHRAALGTRFPAPACPTVSTSAEAQQSAPVICEPGCREALVTEIELQFRDTGVFLIFKESFHGALASLALFGLELLRFNQGLQRCFEQAGWPLEPFYTDAGKFADGSNEATTIH